MKELTVADTSAGRVEIQFGINRWVLVTIGPDAGQERLESERELADYLSWTVLLLVAAFVAVLIVLALYAISHWPESPG